MNDYNQPVPQDTQRRALLPLNQTHDSCTAFVVSRQVQRPTHRHARRPLSRTNASPFSARSCTHTQSYTNTHARSHTQLARYGWPLFIGPPVSAGDATELPTRTHKILNTHTHTPAHTHKHSKHTRTHTLSKLSEECSTSHPSNSRCRCGSLKTNSRPSSPRTCSSESRSRRRGGLRAGARLPGYGGSDASNNDSGVEMW